MNPGFASVSPAAEPNEPDKTGRRKLVSRLFGMALGVLLAAQILVLGFYERDQRYLARLMGGIASPSLPPSEQALRVNEFLRAIPSDTNDSYFLLPVFRVLRATPRQAADQGGDCADRSRLLVALLELRGIHASKWALYTPDLYPRHAVVEVQAEKGRMVVDPLFGLSFPRPGGGYYGIEDLRRDPAILRQRVLELRARHARPGAEKLEEYPLDRYVYNYARTINWEKSAVLRIVYRVLHALTGARVDQLARPGWAEQPALMVVIGLGGLEGGLVVLWGFVIWRGGRKKASAAGSPQMRLAPHR